MPYLTCIRYGVSRLAFFAQGLFHRTLDALCGVGNLLSPAIARVARFNEFVFPMSPSSSERFCHATVFPR